MSVARWRASSTARAAFAVLLPALALAACQGEDGSAEPGGGAGADVALVDSPPDGHDAGAAIDASADAIAEASSDASSDGSPDVSLDAGSEAGFDAFFEGGSDATPDADAEACPTVPPTGLYVDAQNGDDDADGTHASPWKTLAHAFTQLAPGDILYLRGGEYLEKGLVLDAVGTATDPITIRSYPCERAVIRPGVDEFRALGNDDWVLVDDETGEYRSVSTFSNDQLTGYVDGIDGYLNERVLLVHYVGLVDNFHATSEAFGDGGTPVYVGPGLWFNDVTKQIHVRLAKTAAMKTAEDRYGDVFTTDVPDPREHSLSISTAGVGLDVRGSWLEIEDLTIDHAFRTVTLGPGAHDVTFDGVTVWAGYHAFDVTGQDVHEVTITRSRIHGDNPYWVFWSDYKSGTRPAAGIAGTHVNLRNGASKWEISYNHLRGAPLDFVATNDDEADVRIHHNHIEGCTDDAIELEGSNDVHRVEVFENYVANCLVGVAPGQGGSDAFTGPLFVYRNVFAFLQLTPIDRLPGTQSWADDRQYGQAFLFKNHSANTFYYQNTMVMNAAAGGLELVPDDPRDTYVVNNICVMLNGRVHEDYEQDAGQVVDGNLYFKMNTVDDAFLVDQYETIPAFAAATGLEQNGIGDIPKRGTDPLFAAFAPEFVDKTVTVWEILKSSERWQPWAFRLSQASPAIGKGVTLPTHPVFGPLPDTRSQSPRDIGAIPSDANAADYQKFPFVP